MCTGRWPCVFFPFLCVPFYVESDRDREYAAQGDRGSTGSVQPQRTWSQQALGLWRRGMCLVLSTTMLIVRSVFLCILWHWNNIYSCPFLDKETILPRESLREDAAEQLEGVPGIWNRKRDPGTRGRSFWAMPHRLRALRGVLDQGNVTFNPALTPASSCTSPSTMISHRHSKSSCTLFACNVDMWLYLLY